MVKAPSPGADSQTVNRLLYLVREKNIVRVEEADHVAATLGESCVEGGRLSTIALKNCLDAIPKAGDYFAGVVLGAIVYNNNLAVAVALPKGTVDCVADKPPVIVVVDEDAYE
jgi:hypothetical protein